MAENKKRIVVTSLTTNGKVRTIKVIKDDGDNRIYRPELHNSKKIDKAS